MKRIIISIGIIAVIIALGCSAIAYIAVLITKINGKIDEVIASYEQNKGVVQSISELEDFYRKYSRRLGCITNAEGLAEISVSISRLAPICESECGYVRVDMRRIHRGMHPDKGICQKNPRFRNSLLVQNTITRKIF